MEYLGCVVVQFLNLGGISVLFPVVAARIYTPNNNVQRFPFLHILSQSLLFLIFSIVAILTATVASSL